MSIPRFIDLDDCETNLNEVGFLVEMCPRGRASRWSLRRRPLHTNGSHEPRLTGWCGETDNVSRFARGLARATLLTGNDRMQIAPVVGDAVGPALELLAYPELIPGI